jgi:hypothetical protein
VGSDEVAAVVSVADLVADLVVDLVAVADSCKRSQCRVRSGQLYLFVMVCSNVCVLRHSSLEFVCYESPPFKPVQIHETADSLQCQSERFSQGPCAEDEYSSHSSLFPLPIP